MSKHLLPSEGGEGRSIARRILQVLDGDVTSGLLGGLVERSDRGNFKQILSKIEAQLASAIVGGEFGSVTLEDRNWSEQLLRDVLAELATHLAESTEFRERLLVDALKGAHAVAPHLRATSAFIRVGQHTEHSLGAPSAFVQQTDTSRYATLSVDLLAQALSEWVKANETIAHSVTNAALGALGRDLDGVATDLEVTAARVERPLASEVVRGYRRTITDRAPSVLLHRERELQRLESLRTEYHLGWSGVEKAGKSGLAYTIARNGLEWAYVVPFFVSRYESGSNDRGSFAYVTGAYLAEIAGEPYGPSDAPGREAEIRWRELLRHAAFVARKADMRLVLLVDGLDEDVVLGNDTRVGSIAALLPSTEECVALGVRVVATARPNPPLPHDVPKDHWLRRPDAWLELAQSAVARDSLDPTEIHELMHDPVGRDIAAFLASSGAPLTIADLGFMSEHTPARIEEVLSQQRSRNLVRVRLASGQPAFILGHQETHVEVVRNLDPSLWGIGNLRDDPSWSRVRAAALKPYVNKLLSAATRLADREWSHSPPYFLSSAFVDGLVGETHFAHAIQFVQDPKRIQAIVEREGSAYSASAQMSSVADSWQIDTYADLIPLANLFFFLNQFARPQLTVPAGTSAAHAVVGDVDVAFRIARGVPDAGHRARELVDLGDALWKLHEVSSAIEAFADAVEASAKAYGPLRDDLLIELTDRLAASGETERALDCVRLVGKSSVRHRGLRRVADVAWQRGDWHELKKIEPRLTTLERARMWLKAELAGALPPEAMRGYGRNKAVDLATKITGSQARAELWSEIAAGEMNDEARDSAVASAITAANEVTSAAGRAAAWIAISRSRRTAAERVADLEEALSLIVASGQAPRQIDQTLAKIGREFASLDPLRSEDCVAMISTSKGRARAWTDIACDHARNGSAFSSEEAVARITIARGRDDAWSALASAWAYQGDFANAWECVDRISRRSVKNVALTSLAAHSARCGSLEQLERAAERISGEPQLQANAKMLVARAKGLQGDVEGARKEIRDARKLQSDSWWPSPSVLPSLIRAGKVESAIGLIVPLPDGRARDTSLVVIAISSAELGDFGSAVRALELCRSRVTGGPGWAAVAAEYAKRGLIAAATDAVVGASPRSRARVWGEIAAAHIRAGDFDAAGAIALRTSPVLRQADVWAAIGVALALEGELEEARIVVSKIPSGVRRARAWLALAAIVKDDDRALAVSDAASEIHRLPIAETRAELWRAIALRHVNDERTDLALGAMEEAALAAAKLADSHALAVHWIETAELYSLIGAGTESDDAILNAEMFIQKTVIPESRASAWCLVADHYRRHGQESRASSALATAWLTTSDSTFGWQVFEMMAPAASAGLLDTWSAEEAAR